MTKILTIGTLLFLFSFRLIGQSSCIIQSADLWTDKDYYLVGDRLSGQVFITGNINSKSTVAINWIDPKANEEIGNQLLVNLSQQQGDFSLTIPEGLANGWKWLLMLHPETQEVLAAKKLYILNPESSNKKSGKELSFQVFPEGGNWIKNRTQQFLLKTATSATSAYIIQNEVAIDTLSVSNGIAVGQLELNDSLKTSIQVINDDRSKSITLRPGSLATLMVKEENNNLLIDVVGQTDKKFQLVIKSASDSISYQSENQPLILPKRFLPKGLKQIKLLDDKKVISQRWFFLASDPQINLNVNTPSIGSTNSELTTTVSVMDAIKRPLSTFINEHTYYSYFQVSDNGLPTYFDLLSEHWRRVALANLTDEKAINNLLLGASFIQDEVFSQPTTCLPAGLKLNGTLNNKPEVSQFLMLSIPGTLNGLYHTTTYGTDFEFYDIVENQQPTGYLSGTPTISEADLELLKPIALNAMNWSVDEQPNQEIIDHLSEYAMIQQNYNLGEDELVDESGLTFQTIYRKPDYHIPLDDYVYLENMSTVIKEIVPYVFFKRKRIMIFSEEQRKTFPEKPLLLLNGIPVLDDSVILQLEPAAIDYVDVLNNRNSLLPLGYLAKNGVFAVYTKERKEVPPGNLVVQLPTTASNGQSYTFENDTSSPLVPVLKDVTSWKKWGANTYTNHPMTHQTTDLGSAYTIHISAFHPQLGIQSIKKTIEIEYTDAQ